MKFDTKWSASIRPIFRIAAFILGVLFLLLGVWAVLSNVSYPPLKFGSDIKIGLVGVFWGVVLTYYWG